MTFIDGLITWWDSINWSQAQWGPVPAWLGILLSALTGAGALIAWFMKRRTRRWRRAMGPAEDLRKAFEDIRRLFQDITAAPQRTPWFIDEERREAGQRLRDGADRLNDAKLRRHIERIANAWDAAFALAPPAEGPFMSYGDDKIISARNNQERGEDTQRFAKQSEHAHAGLSAVKDALVRLNELERKVIGRP